MLAVGAAVIVTLAVVLTAEQGPAAAIVYVTVYVPGALALGVIAPVLALILRSVEEALYIPPLAPMRVTACELESVLQKGEPK